MINIKIIKNNDYLNENYMMSGLNDNEASVEFTILNLEEIFFSVFIRTTLTRLLSSSAFDGNLTCT